VNTESEQWWKKTHFQKERSSTDAKLNEKRRELQRLRLEADSLAAEEAEKTRKRQAEKRRKLYSLMRRIDCIDCDFQIPPTGSGATFNVMQIRQINQGIESIQDALVELADLPETKAILGVTIPCPAEPNAPWNELGPIHKAHFVPIQTVYRKLKNEVLGANTQAVGC
jgi:hypothetical protein